MLGPNAHTQADNRERSKVNQRSPSLGAKRTKALKKENTPQKPDQDIITPSLTIDWEAYGRYLDDSDLTEDQKIELIETLWSIVVSCVDLNFGLSPVQQNCEQTEELSKLIDQHMVQSKTNLPVTKSKNSTSRNTAIDGLTDSESEE